MLRTHSSKNSIVLAVVVLGHCVLIAGLLYATKRKEAWSDAKSHGVLILIEPPPSKDDVSTLPMQPERSRAPIPPPTRPTSISAPILIAPPTPDAPSGPAIDWRTEAGRAAATAIDDSLRTHRPLGPQAQPRANDATPPEFEWSPEPKRVGFAGGLPYVRLGKRCLVGLGFFGCAIGDLPEANGELFEGMRDPNRPESSVPDSPK